MTSMARPIKPFTSSVGPFTSHVDPSHSLQADQQDLADFEARSSSARNQGLFFKGLYKPEVTGGTDGEGGSTAGGAGTSKGDGPPAVDPEVRCLHTTLRGLQVMLAGRQALFHLFVRPSQLCSSNTVKPLRRAWRCLAASLALVFPSCHVSGFGCPTTGSQTAAWSHHTTGM